MLKRAAAIVLLLCSLALLRLELASTLGLGVVKALSLGMTGGFCNDLTAALVLLAAAAAFRSLTAESGRLLWTLLSSFLYIATLANTLYFRFFSTRLDWWVVIHHWRDVFMIGGSAQQLGLTGRVLGSALCFAASLVLLWVKAPASYAWPISPLARGRLLGVTLALELLLVAAAAQVKTIANKWDRPTSVILTDEVLAFWASSWFRVGTLDFEDNKWQRRKALDEALPGAIHGMNTNAAAKVAAFRDLPPDDRGAAPPSFPVPFETPIVRFEPKDPAWPLLSTVQVDPAGSRRVREALGLDPEQPVNVIVLFLESVRAFELLHPALGPQIFPNLQRILAGHGIFYTQAYSSALTAGQTVRAEFSTMCSSLSNIGGAAEYVAHPGLRAHCLQETLKAAGYRTLWFNAFAKSFHNMVLFNSIHGTETFFDESYYLAHGVTERIGKWGLADRPVLDVTLKALEAIRAEGRPFIANVLTMSTHHPHTVIPQGPLPGALVLATAKTPEYQAYLSRLRYADDAVGAFFERLFSGPLAVSTLVVVLGDHGITVEPHVPFTTLQKREMSFRVPLALVTAGMKVPRRVAYPVHQADVAPTVAAVTGVGGTATWIGKNILSDRGTPWLYDDEGAISYRTASRVCQAWIGNPKPVCWAVPFPLDPMIGERPEGLREDPQQTKLFREILRANRETITLNRLAPP